MKKKQILVTFKPNNEEGFDFYELNYITKDKESYVLRKQGTDNYYLWVRWLEVLIDLKTIFLPKEDILDELVHAENVVDDNCLMFYADSSFLEYYGVWKWEDLVRVKDSAIATEMNDVQLETALEDIAVDHPFAAMFLRIKKIFTFDRDKRSLKRALKEFKIIWRN